MKKNDNNKKEYVRPLCRTFTIECSVVMTSGDNMSFSGTDEDDGRYANSYRNSLWNN